MTAIPAKSILILSLFVSGTAGTIKHKASPPDSDITLPAGFKTTAVVEALGNNRHIVVNSNGDIYVKMEKLKDGKGIYVLRDVKKDGKYEVVKSFGNYRCTGITIKNGYIYASANTEVFRYKLGANKEVSNPDNPEKIVTGLIDRNEHNSKSLAL